jgi:hypothetical protein
MDEGLALHSEGRQPQSTHLISIHNNYSVKIKNFTRENNDITIVAKKTAGQLSLLSVDISR